MPNLWQALLFLAFLYRAILREARVEEKKDCLWPDHINIYLSILGVLSKANNLHKNNLRKEQAGRILSTWVEQFEDNTPGQPDKKWYHKYKQILLWILVKWDKW